MKNADFAFIVHSRDRTDLPRKFPWMKALPNFVFDALTMSLPPILVSRITGLKTTLGRASDGIVIGIPMTARQLIENREKAFEKIVDAVELAKKKGARYIGLGAMTASLSKGGHDVVARVPEVFVTTGRTYTIKNIVSHIEHCIERFSMNRENVRIGIVGAAGGIGSGTAMLLARKGYKHFVLVDLERKAEHLKKHIITLQGHAPEADISIAHQVSAVTPCDIIVAATSAPEVVITSKDVLSGTIIVNDAQPSDISPDIVKDRSDVLVIEGGVLHAPGIDCHFNFGLAHKNDIFSCLAETILLAHRETDSHYSLGDFDVDFLAKLEQDADRLGFKPFEPQNSGGYVSEEYLKSFGQAVKARTSTTSWMQ